MSIGVAVILVLLSVVAGGVVAAAIDVVGGSDMRKESAVSLVRGL